MKGGARGFLGSLGRSGLHFFAAIGAVILLLWVLGRCAQAADFWIDWGEWTAPNGTHCCGTNDCHQVPDEAVVSGPDGYHVSENGQTFVIPYENALPSQDGHFWSCRSWNFRMGGMCFFAEGQGS